MWPPILDYLLNLFAILDRYKITNVTTRHYEKRKRSIILTTANCTVQKKRICENWVKTKRCEKDAFYIRRGLTRAIRKTNRSKAHRPPGAPLGSYGFLRTCTSHPRRTKFLSENRVSRFPRKPPRPRKKLVEGGPNAVYVLPNSGAGVTSDPIARKWGKETRKTSWAPRSI